MNNLHISPAARNDLLEIRDYISEDLENPKAALLVVRKITDSIGTLRDHALIGTPLRAIAEVESDYRYLVCDSYMVFYRVAGRDVFVDRILYGRRDYLRILTEKTDIS